MSYLYTESNYENAIIDLFQNELCYDYIYAPDIERDFKSPLYNEVLDESIRRINKGVTYDAIQDALNKLRNFENGELVQKNAVFMDYLQNGIEARYTEKGEERSAIVYLVDYQNIDNNSFIIANQWTFIENSEKRSDILLFFKWAACCDYGVKVTVQTGNRRFGSLFATAELYARNSVYVYLQRNSCYVGSE